MADGVHEPAPPLDPSTGAPSGDPAPADPADPAESAESDARAEADAQAAEHLLAGEATVAQSESGIAANDMLRALGRAARSFLLYDTGNEAIRSFLGDYRDAASAALAHGTLALEIRPFEMTLDGEIVYLERDRERSLAFRLFRDGVRRLQIEPDVAWPELLRLLEILSIRYTGVRQNEDDVVTLLWKAGFKHIEITAVEGFVPEEDEDESEISEARTAAIRAAGGHVAVPSDWDTPLEPHDEEKGYQYRALGDDELSPLYAEQSSHNLPVQAIRLVTEMLSLVGDPTDPTQMSDIEALLEEVRLFLLSEGQLDGLLTMARTLDRMRAIDPDRVAHELGRFADLRALKRIVHSAALLSEEPPAQLVELLDMVAGEHLRDLVLLLGEERSTSGRRMVRKLIHRHVARHQEWLLKEIAKLDGQVAADLLRAVVDAAPKLRPDLIERCIGRTEPEVQRQVQQMVETTDRRDLPLRQLHEYLLQAPSERVRLALIERIVEHKDARSFKLFVSQIDEPKQGRLSPEELTALGKAMARITPEQAAETLGDWVRPRKWWDRVRGVTGGRDRQWAGIAGLGVLPGDEAEAAIRWLSARAGEEVHEHCAKTLFERRKSMSGGAA
jgi:hypothetical protein